MILYKTETTECMITSTHPWWGTYRNFTIRKELCNKIVANFNIKISREIMNVLAVATTLLPKGVNIYDNDLFENLREIYFSGNFDMLLIMSSDNNFDISKFSFAKVVWQKISPVNTEECIAKALGIISEKIGKSCSFTILYDSDEQPNKIAKHIKSLQETFFMKINNENTDEEGFTSIDCDDEDIDYNFFYANIANYICNRKLDDTETLFSKVNRLKRMNIHWVIAKPRNVVTNKVRS